MAAELPRPGVEVIQVFRTVSPTVVTPTLAPCIVGVCKQVVDVFSTTAAGGTQLNPSALISLPGYFVASAGVGVPPVYAGLDTLPLVLSISGGPDVTVVFDGNSLSPTAVVAQISAAFVQQGVTRAIAEVMPDGTAFQVRTTGVGQFESLEIKSTSDPTVLSAFGLIAGYVFSGSTVYDQTSETVPLLSFPDPRGNLSELSIEPDTVRVFLGLGSGTNLREASKTSSYLRAGGGGVAAALTGTVLLSSLALPAALNATSLAITLDGGSPLVVSMGTGPTSIAELLAFINAILGARLAADVGGYLVISSGTTGANSSVQVSGTAAGVLGLSTLAVNGVDSVQVVDDGNGDALSPFVSVVGADFTAVGTSATLTGLVDLTSLTYPTDLGGKGLTLSVDGAAPQTLVFSNSIADETAVVSEVNAFFGPALVASLTGSNELVLTTALDGEDATIDVVGGSALEYLGLVPSVVGVTDVTTLLPDLSALNTKKLKVSLSGTAVEHTFSGLGLGNVSAVVTNLNANVAFSALAVAYDAGGDQLGIRLKTGGTQAYVKVVVASSNDAAPLLGFDPALTAKFTYFHGDGHPPVAGDDFYTDGVLVGRITTVAPGGTVNRLRLDKQLTINSEYGTYYHMVAKALTGIGISGRPDPELYVAGDGTPTLKARILRSTIGAPITAQAPIYLAYRAVRMDVTSQAASPGLLQFDSTEALSASLEPINTNNPLALGMYFALLNAPGAQVSGLGVDAISSGAPFGTVEAFERAATALEAYEVYSIAPLTHDETVAGIFLAHVTEMSQPASKGERICLFNFSRPTKKLDTLVASSLNGNGIPGVPTQLDTGIPNLSALVLAKGISPVGTIPTSAGLFLSIAQSAKRYSVSAITGSVVTIRTSFAAGENDDGYYSTTNLAAAPLPSLLIDEPFSVKVRGQALTLPDGTPNKPSIAETYQALGQSYMNRRFWAIAPDQCAATLSGVEQLIDGFYLCAAIAGMIAQQPPQQSFTNFPMTGFTRVVGSNDFFTEKQLNVMAAGGNYIVVQDSQGAPLTSRMALTTDMTSIETRTDSIQKIVDFTAKFMRRGLRAYIGRYNITQGFLDSLGHVVQGLLGFLTDVGVLIGANLNNIVQDESAPDTVLIDVTLDVPYPCNYIRLTLVI
jgi:hypothetical protein